VTIVLFQFNLKLAHVTGIHLAIYGVFVEKLYWLLKFCQLLHMVRNGVGHIEGKVQVKVLNVVHTVHYVHNRLSSSNQHVMRHLSYT
jgi:hypothetical protein